MAFDKDKPSAPTSLRSSNPEILANWSQLQDAIDNEHIFTGTAAGTQTGDHTQGSARCFSQASAPATRIDGDGFLSTDLGSLWVDTDDNALYILTSTTGPTWTPVSTEVIAVLLAANRVFAGTLGVDGDFEVGTGSEFTVAAASGNTVVAGTLTASTSLTLASGASPTEFSTDGTLAGDSDTAVPTEKAVKTYVDDKTTNPDQIVKGWVHFNAAGTILDSFNTTSVVRDSTGNFTITWATNFASDQYCCVMTGEDAPMSAITNMAGGFVEVNFKTSGGANVNPTTASIMAIGDQ